MKENYYLKEGNDVRVMAFLTRDAGNSMGDSVWILNRISVPVADIRGKGWGTQLMQQICAEADQNNVTLILSVEPDDERHYWRLRNWYLRHDFKGRMNQVGAMVRHPR